MQLHDVELDQSSAHVRGLELDAHELQRVATLVIYKDRAAMFVERGPGQDEFVYGGLVHQRPAAQLSAAELETEVSGFEITAFDYVLDGDAESRGQADSRGEHIDGLA